MRKVILIIFLAVSVVAAQVMTFFQKKIPTTTSTLMTGLLEHWNLDEESGSRAGYFAHDLTDVNTVLYGTGKYSNSADFEADNNEQLTYDDDDSLDFSDEDFTISIWVKNETATGIRAIITKSDNSNNKDIEYAIYLNTKYAFNIGNGTGYKILSSDTSAAASRWQHVMAWYNASTDSLYIRVGNGSIKRLSDGGVKPTDQNRTFRLGQFGAGTHDFDGLLDLVTLWGRCPQASNGYAMSDSAWNNGNGWRPGL